MAKQPKRYYKYQGYRYGVDDEPNLEVDDLGLDILELDRLGGDDDEDAVARAVGGYLKSSGKGGDFAKSGMTANAGTKSSSDMRKDAFAKTFTPSKSSMSSSLVTALKDKDNEPRSAIEQEGGGYDDEIANVDEELRRRNGWRQRVVRGLIGAMAGYADPQLASQVVQQFHNEEQILRQRRQGLIEQREAERARDEDSAADRAARSQERAEDRKHMAKAAALEFQRQRERDEAVFDHDERMFDARVAAEIAQEQRRQDSELQILDARSAAEIQQLRVAHGLSTAEATARVHLQAAVERASRWEELYGVDPEMAHRVSQKIQSGESMSGDERAFHATVLRLGVKRREMAELEQQAQIASKANSLDIPVTDPRTGAPMVTGSSLDRKAVTRPGTVQDLQGAQPAQAEDPDMEKAAARQLQADLASGVPKQQLANDIRSEPGLSDEAKARLLRYLAGLATAPPQR